MAQDVKDSLLGPPLHKIKVELEEVDIKPDIIKYEDPVPTDSGNENTPVIIKSEPDTSWIKIEVEPLQDDVPTGSDLVKAEPVESVVVKAEPIDPKESEIEDKGNGDTNVQTKTRNGKESGHPADAVKRIMSTGFFFPKKIQTRNKTSLKQNSVEKPFSCNICGYKFKKRFYLTRHLLTHTGEKPFSCSACDYKTTHKSALTTHFRTHTGEKPYSCNVCDFRCSAKGTLIAHSKKHSDEKPFSCDMCSYKCKQKNHLIIHLKVHTDVKPYSCDMCSYKSSRQSDVNRHIKIHGDVKPFCCNFCEYASNRLSNLRQHLFVRHQQPK